MTGKTDFYKEHKKSSSPYEYYTEYGEKFRDLKEDRSLVKDFEENFRIIKNGDCIADPETMGRFASYAAEGSYDMLYCDVDVLKDGSRTDPFFLPEYAPETVEAYGFFFGMMAVRKNIDTGNAKWFTKLDPSRVRHIPEVLAHYLNDRPKPEEPLLLKEERKIKELNLNNTSLSIVILSKDHPELLGTLLQSLSVSALPLITEIIVVDNGSLPAKQDVYRRVANRYQAEYCLVPSEFNYSALCNYGAARSTGEYLLFLNDDMKVPRESALFMKEMLYYASRPHVGAVGMKLLFTDEKTIQHCGITLLKSGPSHKLATFPDDREYYHGINRRNVNVLAVTGACLCIKRKLFEGFGGFDENLPVSYNDVDLCMRLYENGYYNICINDTFLIHFESATRADDRTDPQSYQRMKKYREYLYRAHSELINGGDPFYNKNLTRTGLDYVINMPLAWEKSGVQVEPLKVSGFENSKKTVIRHNIENVTYRLSDAYLNEDFFEVSGWIFPEKKDVKNYVPAVMVDQGGDRLIFAAERVYRKDVKDAFPKQKNADMAGFYTRISRRGLEIEGFTGNLNVTPVMLDKKNRVYIGD